jgi:hypothetical protein
MDPLDAFYQQLDSETLLKRHGDDLVKDAHEILAKAPDARVAGVITFQDSREAGPLRQALARLAGHDLPEGLLVGIVPRPMVEAVLAANVAEEHWREQPWQPQQVLPVVVATRDGFRFGFFGLGA